MHLDTMMWMAVPLLLFCQLICSRGSTVALIVSETLEQESPRRNNLHKINITKALHVCNIIPEDGGARLIKRFQSN